MQKMFRNLNQAVKISYFEKKMRIRIRKIKE